MSASAKDTSPTGGGVGQWLIVALVVVIAAVASGFYGVNEYSGGAKVLINIARADSERFETIYRDTSDKRLATLRFSLDLIRSNDAIVNAFIRDDRAALQARTEIFYKDILSKRYEIDQLNFFTPPAKVYLRADDPKVFGNDLSAVRKTIVAAVDRNTMVSGMETGLGGVVALRAVAPIRTPEGKVVGTVGVGDAITRFLNHASKTAGMDYALGLNKDVAEKAERAFNPKNDMLHDDDLFTTYSSPETQQIIRTATFKPRSLEPSLLTTANGRTVFLRAFPLNNFAGIPTVVIATTRDLTTAMADVRDSAVVKGAILFLAISVIGGVAVIKFRSIRASLTGAMTQQKQELDAAAAALAEAKAKLDAAEQAKRGFFTNMVLSLNEPLQAVVGQLQTVTPTVESVMAGANAPDGQGRDLASDRLRFALAETSRFSQLVADHRRLSDLRDSLAGGAKAASSLAEVVATALAEDLALARRLPHLVLKSAVADDLPKVSGSQDALRQVVAGLVDYAAQGAGRGQVEISAKLEGKMVVTTIAGSAFQLAGAPTADLLNEAQQFLWRLTASPAAFASSGSRAAVLQAQAILVSCGGKLDVAPATAAQPGFVLRLPLAS